MLNKIREVSIPTISYLRDVKGGDVSENQDTQRRFCSDNSFINGIGVTILTGDYLPPIILGEVPIGDGMVQQYIVDAMQRTSALMKIRYGNHKFTSTIEDSKIEYQEKLRDENGKICKDENGSVVWEQKSFELKGKTFDDLPDELKKRFDNFQLRIAIHENCTMERISKLIRRYNNHRAMNTSQKAFTYLDLYARKVRTISESDFFKECVDFSEKENKSGNYEKNVCESVMTVFHLDSWKKVPKNMNIYLNDNSNNEEFDTVQRYMDRIFKVCGKNYQNIFVPKDIAVWIAVFHRFTKIGLPDSRFADFLSALVSELHKKKINGMSYDTLNLESGTKDKKVVTNKVNTYISLMLDYLDINEDIIADPIVKYSATDIIKDEVNCDVNDEDIELYEMQINCIADAIDDIDTSILSNDNRPSLLALVAYAFCKDVDDELEGWLAHYYRRNSIIYANQKENYLHMKDDFNNYISKERISA